MSSSIVGRYQAYRVFGASVLGDMLVLRYQHTRRHISDVGNIDSSRNKNIIWPSSCLTL